MSSDTEQMPLSLLEAMAAGLPAVATDVCDTRSMLAAANVPFVTAPGDAALAAGLERPAGCDVLVCPPATVLAAVADALAGSGVMVGGQDCHPEASGARTGDVSAPMLRDAGAEWVILGHSERRLGYSESNALVREKAVAAIAAGLTPIVCVGETEQQRLSGIAETVVAAQIDGSVPPGFAGVVAYEPVWAIGTGEVATPGDAVVGPPGPGGPRSAVTS